MLLSSLQTAPLSSSFKAPHLCSKGSPAIKEMYINTWPPSLVHPNTSGTGTLPFNCLHTIFWVSASVTVVSAPYLTIRPNDGNLTGGGRLNLVPRMLSEFSLMPLTSAGVGSIDARFSLKKLESEMALVVLWLESWSSVSFLSLSGVIFKMTQAKQGPWRLLQDPVFKSSGIEVD